MICFLEIFEWLFIKSLNLTLWSSFVFFAGHFAGVLVLESLAIKGYDYLDSHNSLPIPSSGRLPGSANYMSDITKRDTTTVVDNGLDSTTFTSLGNSERTSWFLSLANFFISKERITRVLALDPTLRLYLKVYLGGSVISNVLGFCWTPGFLKLLIIVWCYGIITMSNTVEFLGHVVFGHSVSDHQNGSQNTNQKVSNSNENQNANQTVSESKTCTHDSRMATGRISHPNHQNSTIFNRNYQNFSTISLADGLYLRNVSALNMEGHHSTNSGNISGTLISLEFCCRDFFFFGGLEYAFFLQLGQLFLGCSAQAIGCLVLRMRIRDAQAAQETAIQAGLQAAGLQSGRQTIGPFHRDQTMDPFQRDMFRISLGQQTPFDSPKSYHQNSPAMMLEMGDRRLRNMDLEQCRFRNEDLESRRLRSEGMDEPHTATLHMARPTAHSERIPRIIGEDEFITPATNRGPSQPMINPIMNHPLGDIVSIDSQHIDSRQHSCGSTVESSMASANKNGNNRVAGNWYTTSSGSDTRESERSEKSNATVASGPNHSHSRTKQSNFMKTTERNSKNATLSDHINSKTLPLLPS